VAKGQTRKSKMFWDRNHGFGYFFQNLMNSAVMRGWNFFPTFDEPCGHEGMIFLSLQDF